MKYFSKHHLLSRGRFATPPHHWGGGKGAGHIKMKRRNRCLLQARLSIVLCLCSFILLSAGCQTHKNAVYRSEHLSQTTNVHSEFQTLHAFDSLLHHADFSADSVTIRFVAPATQESDKAAETTNPAAIHITVHHPRLQTTTQSQSSVLQYSQAQDSTHQHSDFQEDLHTDKQSVGIAKPANLNWIIPIVLILLLGAILLFFWLRKRKIV